MSTVIKRLQVETWEKMEWVAIIFMFKFTFQFYQNQTSIYSWHPVQEKMDDEPSSAVPGC